MAYIPFASDKPVITDQGGQVVDDMRQNLMALRDACVAGAMIGWTLTPSGGTAEEPGVIMYAKGVERVRVTVTWGTAGGAIGNPQVIAYAYSGNSGGVWDAMGTLTLTYDASGNLTGSSWA